MKSGNRALNSNRLSTLGVSNKNIWDDKTAVNNYQRIYLDKPEMTIFNELKSKLLKMRMLDIGVGGGRTTHYFADQTKEYTGIDYSEAMIASCNTKYKNRKNTFFFICDARDMSQFSDCSFEFVLFSYNGIDSVNHEDRLKVLSEIKRVCSSGGLICFSSHNAQYLDTLFSFQFSFNLLQMFWSIRRYFLLRLKNPNWKKMKAQNEFELTGPGCNFQLTVSYISPIKQFNQLIDFGFKNIRVFSLNTGIEIFNQNDMKKIKDAWLYYLCENIKK